MSDSKSNGKQEEKVVPAKMNEVDCLKVQLFQEKTVRLEAQMTALQVQLGQVQAEMQKLRPERETVMKDIWARYEMELTDRVDLSTGLIERATREPKVEAAKA